MIQITPQMHILLALEPHDFRKGIGSLAAVCRQTLRSDPFNGHIFVFRNKNSTSKGGKDSKGGKSLSLTFFHAGFHADISRLKLFTGVKFSCSFKRFITTTGEMQVGFVAATKPSQPGSERRGDI